MTKNAQLIIEYEMTDGGCNACVPFKTEIAQLQLDNRLIPVGELNAESLIMNMAVNEGFKTTFKFDAIDDYLLFSSDTLTIKQTEDYSSLTYSNLEGNSIKLKNYYTEHNELIANVNQVLEELFLLAPIQFN